MTDTKPKFKIGQTVQFNRSTIEGKVKTKGKIVYIYEYCFSGYKYDIEKNNMIYKNIGEDDIC